MIDVRRRCADDPEVLGNEMRRVVGEVKCR